MKNKATDTSTFSREELKVISENAGKIPLDDILILVNKVSKFVRTRNALKGKANRLGFSVRVKL